MGLHLIHALVLTPYESTLVAQNLEEVEKQDFTVHALYCRETNQLLFHSDCQKLDVYEEITKIQHFLHQIGISFEIEQQLIILEDSECEYCASDVMKHLQ